jgi:hypothetical protein
LPKAARLANKKTIAKMQGAWQLVDLKTVSQDASGIGDLSLDHFGFCLVSGSYLSIEFHLRIVTGGEERGRSLVTGLHRFELDQEGGMETSTVVGTWTTLQGVPEFEAAGTKRHYSISIAGDSMTLTREDGHTLVFQRLLDDATRFDFFGRPVTGQDDASDEDKGNGDKKKDEGEDGDGNG